MASNPKILLIDDDEDFRFSIRTILESKNYQVIEAESGKQGLQKLKDENPGLIILDIMMETIDEGYSVNQIIKFQKTFEQYKDIPIIMVSSIQEDPQTRFVKAMGQVDMITPDHYITKPVDVPRFLDLITKLLNK